MWRILVVLGAVLVVVGGVLSFVPFVGGPTQNLTAVHPVAAFNATTVLSLTGSWTIGLTWNANQTVSLLVVICHSINLSASSIHTVCPDASFSVLNGTSGTSSFSVPVDGVLVVGIVSNTASQPRVHIELVPTQLFWGTILLLGGIGVAVVGLLPRPKPRQRTPPPTPAADTGSGSGDGSHEGGPVVLRQ